MRRAVLCGPEVAPSELANLSCAVGKKSWRGLQEPCSSVSFVPEMNISPRWRGWLAPCWSSCSLSALELASSVLVQGFLCRAGRCWWALRCCHELLWSSRILCGSSDARGVNRTKCRGEQSADTRVKTCSPYLAFKLTDFVVTLYLALVHW